MTGTIGVDVTELMCIRKLLADGERHMFQFLNLTLPVYAYSASLHGMLWCMIALPHCLAWLRAACIRAEPTPRRRA